MSRLQRRRNSDSENIPLLTRRDVETNTDNLFTVDSSLESLLAQDDVEAGHTNRVFTPPSDSSENSLLQRTEAALLRRQAFEASFALATEKKNLIRFVKIC